MAQALYRKWRPQTFDDLIGQEHVVRTLRNALRLQHIHHAYLLAGPRGTGKTTTARLLAKAVNCLAPETERPCDQCEICRAVTAGRLMDLIEIDAASNTGVDNVRDLLERVSFQPTQARYKVYVIDEVHMLSTAAFNALLKTLEEPPPHVIFILATTEAHKVPATVLSRCQRFEFRRLPLELLIGRLRDIAAAEGIVAEPEALALIARTATGSVRDAISLLDQMAAGGAVTAEQVRLILGAERREVVQALAQAWFERDLSTALKVINQAADGGADPRQLARQLSDFLRGLLLMRMNAGDLWTEPTVEERPQLQELARRADPDQLVAAVRRFSEVAAERGAGWQPQLPLELAFVELAGLPPATTGMPREDETPLAAKGISPTPASRPAPRAPETQRAPDVAPKVMPVTPAPVAMPPATPSATGGTSVEALAARWAEVKNQMRAVDLSLSALLNDARPIGLDEGGALVLGFKHGFHRNKANTPENRAMMETVLSKMTGAPVNVRCELEKEWVAPTPQTPPAATPARRPPPPEDPLADDEIVQRAVREMGAVPKVIE